jgi:hypothetical protein
MVYLNKFVVAVKVNGKILRETDNTVSLPFGSEYSIFVKNLDSRRALANVSVDGKEAISGLILPAYGSVDLERFVKDWQTGNRFKFIERTGAIEAHRGIGAEDGLIRVEFRAERVFLERPVPMSNRPYGDGRRPMMPMRRGPMAGVTGSAGPARRSTSNGPIPGMNSSREVERGAEVCAATADCAFNDQGITVPGSQSNQRFVVGEYFPTEAHSDVLILKLRGTVGNQPIQEPVTVSHKPKCVTCGRTNKAESKFCCQCGTALLII